MIHFVKFVDIIAPLCISFMHEKIFFQNTSIYMCIDGLILRWKSCHLCEIMCFKAFIVVYTTTKGDLVHQVISLDFE
jgi:hypothetical protein